jgi:hypothetical protein
MQFSPVSINMTDKNADFPNSKCHADFLLIISGRSKESVKVLGPLEHFLFWFHFC